MSGRALLNPAPQFLLASALSPEQLDARIAAALDPAEGRWFLRARRGGRPFAGARQGEGWRLRRLVLYPDPLRPEIQLRLYPQPGGTRLEATLRWPPMARLVARLWLGLSLGLAALVLAAVLSDLILPRALILAGIAAIYALFPWLDLWLESRTTRGELAKLLV